MTRKTLTLSIHNREYYFGCDSSEEVTLRASAAYLNQKMDEIKEESKGVMGAERLLVMAALQMAGELTKKETDLEQQQQVKQRLKVICNKIDKVIQEVKT